MNSELPKSSLAGKVAFRQHVLPAVEAGTYTIEATQTVTYTDRSTAMVKPNVAAPTYSATRTLQVSGERLTLLEGTVKSVYPPRDACGNFGRDLPQVVLTGRDLPWLWKLDDVNAGQDPKPGGTVRPWLALLVFTADDPPPRCWSGSLADLTRLPTGVVSYPGLRLFEHESADTPAQVIDVPVDLFSAVAPTPDELEYLAHTRIVEDEMRARKSSDPENRPEEYAVVVANRLPATERTEVHLVSLAGMHNYLPGANQQLPAGTQFVRLVSLDHWRFVTLEPTQDFQYLVTQTLDLERGDPSSLILPLKKLPDPVAEADTEAYTEADAEADAEVEKVLRMGYVALTHTTRLGDHTASWYHGPLGPYTPVATDPLPAPNADALTRYDPKNGLFDVSYSAAWQLGRLLALANKGYAVALHNWRMGQLVQQIRGVEERALTGSLGGAVARNFQARNVRPGRRPAAAAVADAVLKTLAGRADALRDETSFDGRELTARHNESAGLPNIDPEELISSLVATETETRSDSVGGETPELVRSWLGQLRLLKGVPYQYIVPDERMLPPESLRFVQVDRHWIDCLTDGALSLGRTNQSALAQDARNWRRLDDECWQESARTRSHLLGLPETRTLPENGPLSGFLLHSIVVRDFPGMEVQGFATADGKGPLEVFHFERIAPNVLLCLFAGVVNQVRLMLPSEGMSLVMDLDNDGKFHKSPLRDLASPYAPVKKRVEAVFRQNGDGPKGVLDILKLIGGFKDALSPAEGVFTSMEFTLQLVDPAPAVIFKATAAGRETE